MNIKEAKIEIINTLRTYHRKDEYGNYIFPPVRRRPIVLMGPPGIGKTAILEQIANECGVGLVSYTMTHHTRQSAIGLPHIEKEEYGGKTMEVTRYTLSEIIASVYDCMKETGKTEGILFLDEINCVSETLAPTMLQFLQNKTFGSHKLPDGWLIVAAGNPPEYNKSVREFDIVTLDRVRKIDIESDLGVWMEYAYDHGVHNAVLSYLSIKKESFYYAESTSRGKYFVTARGWEDLSEVIKGYEALGVRISDELISQYLQKESVARDFAAYYSLYRKYGDDYNIPEIMEQGDSEEKISLAKNGTFEEKFTVVHLILEYLNGDFDDFKEQDIMAESIYESLSKFKSSSDSFSDFIEKTKESFEIKKQGGMLTFNEELKTERLLKKLEGYELCLRKDRICEKDEVISKLRELFEIEVLKRKEKADDAKHHLENAFSFMEKAFSDGQEMIHFLYSLTQNRKSMEFISRFGSDGYVKYSPKLMYKKNEDELLKECRELLS